MKSNISLLRTFIREEIGRNYHTVDTDPIQYDHDRDIDVEIYPVTDHGKFAVKVTPQFDLNLQQPMRMFADEGEAKLHAQKLVDYYRKIKWQREEQDH
jgi:hypothetical protein